MNTFLIKSSLWGDREKIHYSLRDPQVFETNYTLLLTVGGGPNRRSVENISLGSGSSLSSFGKGGIRQHTFQRLTMGKLYTVSKYSSSFLVLPDGARVCENENETVAGGVDLPPGCSCSPAYWPLPALWCLHHPCPPTRPGHYPRLHHDHHHDDQVKGDRVYHQQRVARSWAESQEKCQAGGGHLTR